jgi:hypothetical protein
MRSIEPSDGLLLPAVALANLLDGLSQNFGTTLKLVDRHKLARTMCLTNVSGPDDYGFTAKRLHLRGFGAERYRARSFTGRCFQ